MMKLVLTQPKWLSSLIVLVAAIIFIGGCTPNQPPVISNLTASEERVIPSDSSQVECVASDPDGDKLSYTWSATEGDISGEGSIVTWTAPPTPGAYTITVEVTDGRSGEATTQLTIGVAVNHPPVIESLTAEREVIEQAESTPIECVASDPDGDELNYLWTTPRGNISGQGSAVIWTAPNSCALYAILVTVTDGRGGEASKKLSIRVIKPG